MYRSTIEIQLEILFFAKGRKTYKESYMKFPDLDFRLYIKRKNVWILKKFTNYCNFVKIVI